MDVVVEWFGSRILERLINTGFMYLQNQFSWDKGMKDELERLQNLHPIIQSVVFASNQEHIRDQNLALSNWLWQLRDVIDEADDVLDEFEYMKYGKQPTIKQQLLKIGKRSLLIDSRLKRLEVVVKKLDKVSVDVGNFLHLTERTMQEMQEQQLDLYKTRETGSLPKNDLIGHAKEKKFIMLWLKKSSKEQQTHSTAINFYRNISLLCIVGHGGMGKTNLLQHVYGDETLNDFDLKMWVCVSTNFDVKRVIKDMLASLEGKMCDLESLDALQEYLKSKVMSKKFLLVLDDIWEEEEKDKSKWETVLAPLAFGSLGSKIFVSTRMDSVALMISMLIKKKVEILRLKGLEEKDCLQLLNTHALADTENVDGNRNLRLIAQQIAKRLFGSPLAAKVVGGILNSSLNEKHWMKVLKSGFGSAELGQNSILPILRLSYTYLPKHLQNCFSFCCIFPRHHGFTKKYLIKMWIASGFIQPSHISGETMEDSGKIYFNMLVKKSFFEKFIDGIKVYYRLSDLLYELARLVSSHECFMFEKDEEFSIRDPKTIRHLQVITDNLEVLKKVKKFKNVRSLYLSYGENNQDFVNVLDEIFKALRNIRLLHINAPYLKMVPKTMGYLIHLRFLEIKASFAQPLRCLNKFYFLQTLIYEEYSPLPKIFMPRNINNLPNLRWLELPSNNWCWMRGIGKLTSLQKLDEFYLKKEAGYRIGELELMNGLQGLNIKYLETVKDAKEASGAKLSNKRNLRDLTLDWSDHSSMTCTRNNINQDLDEKVLDSLEPYKQLEKLSIFAYMGSRSAIWMNKVYLISNLRSIMLDNCLEWQTLFLGELPFLKTLQLTRMPKVKQLLENFDGNVRDCAFPSLETLHISDLEALEVWFNPATKRDDRLFPCLKSLRLLDCPNVQELPCWPPMLKEFKARAIGWKTLNFCNISKPTPLQKLELYNCPNVTYLPSADKVTALRCMTIIHCPKLISPSGMQEVETIENCQLIINYLSISDPSILLMVPLKNITSIETLSVNSNDELGSFPIEVEQWFLQVSSSLCELRFSGLKSLQSLPSFLENLSSLKILTATKLPELRLLPNIPTSVERLELRELKSLQYLPSCLSNLSSPIYILIINVPQLQELPDLPPTLPYLFLRGLDSLDSLPSCLPSIFSLQLLTIEFVPQLRKLPDLPPTLCDLYLAHLVNLECLPPCLPSLFSLKNLCIDTIPQLRELPLLPSSLCSLTLENLDNLECLPSSLPSLTSLKNITISEVPRLRELPYLPPFLDQLYIDNCHPELKKRCKKFSGLDWHKIDRIPSVHISTKVGKGKSDVLQ